MLLISYQPLWDVLKARDMDKQELWKQGIVNHSNLYHLLNDELVSMPVLMKLCDMFDVPVERVVVFRKV